jgi:hypothetical protein
MVTREGEAIPPKASQATACTSSDVTIALDRIIRAWYGSRNDKAGDALGVSHLDIWRYRKGGRPVPRSLLVRIAARQNRELARRKAEIRSRVARAEREAIAAISLAENEHRLGIAVIMARLAPAEPTTLIWTNTGYQPKDKAKPHHRRIAQKKPSGENTGS